MGYLTPPFAPRLWGCLRRFAFFGGQTRLRSEQNLRMSRARRWFQHSQGGRQGGMTWAPFAPSLWGCLRRFACSVAQHLSLSEQIARMAQAGRWFQHPNGPSLWGCLRRFACAGEAPGRPREGPGNLRRPQEASGGPRRPQEAPGDPRRPQEAQGGPRRSQEAPGGPRKPQEPPGNLRRPQESPGGPSRPQEALTGPSGHQQTPGGPRRLQDAPGAPGDPRKPEEAPGGPLEAPGGPRRSSCRLRLRVLRMCLWFALLLWLESYVFYGSPTRCVLKRSHALQFYIPFRVRGPIIFSGFDPQRQTQFYMLMSPRSSQGAWAAFISKRTPNPCWTPTPPLTSPLI